MGKAAPAGLGLGFFGFFGSVGLSHYCCFFKNVLIFCHMCGTSAIVHMYGSEKLAGSILSFYRVGFEDHTHVIRLGDKCSDWSVLRGRKES